MEITNTPFTEQEQSQALESGLEAAKDTELPEERYAGLGAWAARKIIKSTKSAMTDTVGVSRKDLYEQYNIQPVAATPEPTVSERVDSVRPLDGETTPYSFNAEREAAMLDESDLSDYDTTDSFQMTFDTLDTPDKVSAIVGAMAERNKVAITEQRRGVQTDDMLRRLADDLGKSPEFLKEVLDRKKGETWNAEKMLATRQVLEQSATKLKALAASIVSKGEDATGTEKLQFHKQLAFHQDFQMQFMGARAEIGRSMRSMGIPTGGDQANIQEVMERVIMAERGLDTQRLANSIAMAQDTRGVNGAVEAIHRSTMNVVFDGAYEIYINSILSGLKTHLVNFMGSKLRLWVDVVDVAVAARMGAGNPSDPADKLHVDEWKATWFAQNSVSIESLKVALDVMKTAESYQGMSKMETTERRTIDSQVFAQTFGLNPDGTFAGVVDFIGNTLRAPTERLMGGTDAFMRHQAERVHIARSAFREAAYLSDLNGLDEATTLDLLKDLMENPTEKIKRDAADFANDVTFQTPLGETGRKFQNVVANFPGARWVMPFVKTPANLLKQGFLERTPMGLVSKKFRDDIAAGGVRAQMAKSKMATGTALGGLMYAWAQNGIITGSEPQDKDVARARREAGWRPRSFVVTDDYGNKTYYSYDRMEPLSYIIGSVADIEEMLRETQYDNLSEDDNARQERILGAVIMAISENTLNKSFMTGIRDIMEVAGSGSGKKVERVLSNYANSMVPYAGLRRDITRLMDDTKRSSDSLGEYIQSTWFAHSQDLPARLDNFGEEVHYDSVLNPWAVVVEDSTQEQREIYRLANDTRRAPIPRPSNKVGGFTMDNEEYYAFHKLSRSELTQDGMNFRETIRDIINNPNYMLMTSDEKVDQLNSVTLMFDTAARKIMLSESKSLMEKKFRKNFTKMAQRRAKENGTDERDELNTLKQEYDLTAY